MTRALAAALLVSSVAPAALAAECKPGEPISGSADYAVATASAARYMQLASAARYAERVVLPRLTRPRTGDSSRAAFGGFVGERMDMLWGIGSVPIGVGNDNDDGCTVGRAPFDLYSGNFGVGFSVGPVYAFYASSIAVGSAGDVPNRLVSPMAIPVVGGLYTLVGPLFGATSGTTYGGVYSLDYIGGAGFTTPWVTGSAGYAGSKGFFGYASQPDLNLFAASALRSISDIAYLRAGIEWLKLGREQVTSTTLFFRTLAQVPAPSDALDTVTASVKPPSLQTVHAEQLDIAGLVDVSMAYGIGSFAKLHEAGVRVHTPGYSQRPPDDQTKARRGGAALGGAGAALTLGMVRVPERRIFGQSGKVLPHVALQFGGVSRVAPSSFLVALRFNDPEIVALYPAAGGSVNLTLEGALAP